MSKSITDKTDKDATEVARKFSSLLRENLSEKDMDEVILRNRNEQDDLVCHSHDFCDPNPLMDEALKSLGLKDEHFETLWSVAWQHAKNTDFAT